VSYETGPWGFSFTYQHGQNQGNPEGGSDASIDENGVITNAVLATPESGDEESDQYLIGISYDLATGVNLGGYGAYVDFDDAKAGTANHSVDGFIIGTGVKIKF
jgi:predicted porin